MSAAPEAVALAVCTLASAAMLGSMWWQVHRAERRNAPCPWRWRDGVLVTQAAVCDGRGHPAGRHSGADPTGLYLEWSEEQPGAYRVE